MFDSHLSPKAHPIRAFPSMSLGSRRLHSPKRPTNWFLLTEEKIGRLAESSLPDKKTRGLLVRAFQMKMSIRSTALRTSLSFDRQFDVDRALFLADIAPQLR